MTSGWIAFWIIMGLILIGLIVGFIIFSKKMRDDLTNVDETAYKTFKTDIEPVMTEYNKLEKQLS